MKLTVIQPGSVTAAPIALRVYRLAVLITIVLIIRAHHHRLRIDGDAPIRLPEARQFFPAAVTLSADPSSRGGLFVRDAAGDPLGYLVRTFPVAGDIIGYCGPSDTLIAFNNDMQVIGIRIRSSADTREHVEDVQVDRQFARLWKQYHWDTLGTLDLEAEGIEGVSGATMTSMAVAQGITQRVRSSQEQQAAMAGQPIHWTWVDGGIGLMIVWAMVMTFTRLKGHGVLRRVTQVAMVGFIGFYAGALVAQSLLAGWAVSGVAWKTGPGLALLTGAALVLPWATRRNVYCSHLCPHGAVQEWIGRICPWKWRLSAGVGRWMKLLPAGLLGVVVITVMFRLPLDLAGIEPFDAYLIKAAGWATISVAVVGLIAAAFIPQAYCRFGCPTGMVFNFLRSHGAADRFSGRDWLAGLLVGATAVMWWQYDALWSWITA
jgi:hypothetical protein